MQQNNGRLTLEQILRWAGLSAEEIFRSVVKMKKLPPQYSRVVGVGLPGELWKMIGDCLQFTTSKRPNFQTMLAIFLRHLLEVPRSPPASPENDITKTPPTNATEPSPKSFLEGFLDRPSILHRLISEGDVAGVRDILAKATSQGNSKVLCSFLEAQNADGHTALHLASCRGVTEMVEVILACNEVNVVIFDRDDYCRRIGAGLLHYS